MASNPIQKNPPTRAVATIEQVNREIPERTQTEVRKELGIEIIKSIVFGGLDALIASSSVLLCGIAANIDITYVMVLVRIALFAIMVIIGYTMERIYNDIDQYEEVFGRRENSGLHVVVTLISCGIFDLVPPVVYICSSGDKQLKLVMVAVAVASLPYGASYWKDLHRTPKTILERCLLHLVFVGVYCYGRFIRNRLTG